MNVPRAVGLAESLVTYTDPGVRRVALDILIALDHPLSYICPICEMESFNPNDVRERYCGNCHAFEKTP